MNDTETKPALTWSRQDSAAACAEGWDVFTTLERPPHGPVLIQKVDFPEDDLPEGETYDGPVWNTDAEVMVHIFNRAAEGSDLHQRALAFVRDRNPAEYDAVLVALDAANNVW